LIIGRTAEPVCKPGIHDLFSVLSLEPASTRRPGHPSSAQQVEMHVIDCLTTVIPTVCHNPEPTLIDPQLSCQIGSYSQEMARQGRILLHQIADGLEMETGDEEQVYRSLRLHVAERHNARILIDDICG
jgi:ABC-type arginine transport system ATPase subunit